MLLGLKVTTSYRLIVTCYFRPLKNLVNSFNNILLFLSRMPRSRIRKTTRGTTDICVYRNAADDHLQNNQSIRAAAKKFGVCHVTLTRYVRKLQSGIDSPKVGYRSIKRVFSDEEETILQNYIIRSSNLYYGLSPREVRKLAYQLAVEYHKEFPLTWNENQLAGPDWFAGFLKRHHSLSLQTPQATSLARATSFNPHNVNMFFEKLQYVMDRYKLAPKDIWNVDDTGIKTDQKPYRFVAKRRTKQVGALTSAERGRLVTVAVAINAQGDHTPPFFVFPLKRYHDHIIRDGPVGSAGSGNGSGWMQEPEFVHFLEHFKA